jgi:WD40 repeat protein
LAPIRGDEMPAIVSLEFAPNGDYLVLGGDDGRLVAVRFVAGGMDPQQQNEMQTKEIANAIITGESPIELHELGRHAAAIRGICFSPNGDRLFTASDDNTVGVWNLSHGLTSARLEKQLRGHGSWVRACGVSADGRYVLSAGYDGRVRLWDWDSYRFPIFLRVAETQSVGDLRINSGAISPNAQWVATAFQSGEVILWDIRDPSNPVPQNLQEGHSFQATTGILFDGGQRLLTSGGDSTTLIWDTRHGRERLRIGPSTMNGRTGAGTGWRGIAAVSHDERRIATGSERAGVLAQLWDANSGRQQHMLSSPAASSSGGREPPEATALDFSPDDTMLIVGDQNGDCYLFETATGKLHRQFRGHSRKVTSAHFLPGGRYLFTAGADGRAVKWDLEANVPTIASDLPHGDEVLAMAVSTDAKLAVTACGSNDAQAVLRVWDLRSETPRIAARLKLQQIADAHEHKINPDEKPLVRAVSLHPTEARAFISLYFPGDSTRFPYEVGEWSWREGNAYRFVSRRLSDVSTALYARGRNGQPEAMLAVGGRGAHLWAAQPKPNGAVRFARQAMDLQPQFGARCVAFSADSRLLASAAEDGSVKLWQLDDASRRWRPGATLRGLRMASVAFHPMQNDVLLTAGDDGAQFWRFDALNQAWNRDAELRRPNSDSSSAQQAVFSPDGNRVLVLSDGAVTLWEGNAPQEPPADITDATCVAFSPGGEWICIGTRSGGVDIRRANALNDSVTNTDRQSGGRSGEITSATFSSDARRLFTASRDFTIRVWDVSDLSNDAQTDGKPEIRPMMTLVEHGREVTSVSFSALAPDPKLGPFLFSTGLDGQAILWPSVPYSSGAQ